MRPDQQPVVGPCAPAVEWADALALAYQAPPDPVAGNDALARLTEARGAYTAQDWPALERALGLR